MLETAREALGREGVTVLDPALPQRGNASQGSPSPGADPRPINAGQRSVLHVLQLLIHFIRHQGVVDRRTVTQFKKHILFCFFALCKSSADEYRIYMNHLFSS